MGGIDGTCKSLSETCGIARQAQAINLGPWRIRMRMAAHRKRDFVIGNSEVLSVNLLQDDWRKADSSLSLGMTICY